MVIQESVAGGLLTILKIFAIIQLSISINYFIIQKSNQNFYLNNLKSSLKHDIYYHGAIS